MLVDGLLLILVNVRFAQKLTNELNETFRESMMDSRSNEVQIIFTSVEVVVNSQNVVYACLVRGCISTQVITHTFTYATRQYAKAVYSPSVEDAKGMGSQPTCVRPHASVESVSACYSEECGENTIYTRSNNPVTKLYATCYEIWLEELVGVRFNSLFYMLLILYRPLITVNKY